MSQGKSRNTRSNLFRQAVSLWSDEQDFQLIPCLEKQHFSKKEIAEEGCLSPETGIIQAIQR